MNLQIPDLMQIDNLESTIHQTLIDLWTEHKGQDYTSRNPHFYPSLKREPTILFVGLNASFSQKEFNLLISTPFAYVAKSPDMYYNFDSFQPDYIPIFQKIDELARLNYKTYFQPFDRVTEQVSEHATWEHIDLLYVRETDQKQIQNLYNQNSAFINKQLSLSAALIRKLSPQIVVVVNSFASRLFKEQCSSDELLWNEDLGVHLLDGKTPVFFSSMLSNGATSIGTRDRLEWHIRYVLRNHYPDGGQ